MKPDRILDFHSHFPEPENAIFYRNGATLLGLEK